MWGDHYRTALRERADGCLNNLPLKVPFGAPLHRTLTFGRRDCLENLHPRCSGPGYDAVTDLLPTQYTRPALVTASENAKRLRFSEFQVPAPPDRARGSRNRSLRGLGSRVPGTGRDIRD